MRKEEVHDFDGKERPEDAAAVSPNFDFVSVGDGCPEPYSGKPFMYPRERSGGQVVSGVLRDMILAADPRLSLENHLKTANRLIWLVQHDNRGDAACLSDAATLANASFSAARLFWQSGLIQRTELFWGADVFTLWKTVSGKVGIVGGDNREADMERERAYAGLVATAGSDLEAIAAAKKRYWTQVFPGMKRKHDNAPGGYAVLNGQPEAYDLWHREFIEEPIELIVLLSDGAWIPMERWDESASKAEEFLRLVERSGLAKAIEWVRGTQNEGLASQRVRRPEATGLAIFAK